MNETYFVICVESGEDTDLTSGRVYRASEDAEGERSGFIRVIDDSGDDYLYPIQWFVRLNVEPSEQCRLEAALASG